MEEGLDSVVHCSVCDWVSWHFSGTVVTKIGRVWTLFFYRERGKGGELELRRW